MASLSRLDRRVERYLHHATPVPERCPRCGRPVRLVRWGSYRRRLRTADSEYRLPIRRVHCRACGRTPGLIPSFIVPRRLYARPLIERARAGRRSGRSLLRIAGELSVEFLIAPNLVLAWSRAGIPSRGP